VGQWFRREGRERERGCVTRKDKDGLDSTPHLKGWFSKKPLLLSQPH
jgi:hypothetical protein